MDGGRGEVAFARGKESREYIQSKENLTIMDDSERENNLSYIRRRRNLVMEKKTAKLFSLLTASALSLGLLAGCSQPSEPTIETTPTPSPTISQEPAEETPAPQQPAFKLPAYRMAVLSDMAVVSDSEFGLDSMITESGTDYTGVTFHSLAFAVQFAPFEDALFFFFKVYDRETGAELNEADDTVVYPHAGYVPTVEFVAENPSPDDVLVMLSDEGSLTVTCVLNSLKDYSPEDLRIVAQFFVDDDQTVEFELEPNATPEEINTAPAYTVNASLLKLDGQYWTMVAASGGGGQNGSTSYELKRLACISDPFNYPSMNLDASRMVLVDKETDEQVQLPDGAEPYVTIDSVGRGKISVGFGFKTDDEAVYETADELLKDCNPGVIDDDGNIVILG